MPAKKNQKGPQAKVRRANDTKERTAAPAGSSLAREKQLINLAMDEAERQLKNGTVSSQVLTHFLKLGSETERLAREKVANENKLLIAKVEQIESQARIEELYVKALSAMKTYSGEDEGFFDDDFESDAD